MHLLFVLVLPLLLVDLVVFVVLLIFFCVVSQLIQTFLSLLFNIAKVLFRNKLKLKLATSNIKQCQTLQMLNTLLNVRWFVCNSLPRKQSYNYNYNAIAITFAIAFASISLQLMLRHNVKPKRNVIFKFDNLFVRRANVN